MNGRYKSDKKFAEIVIMLRSDDDLKFLKETSTLVRRLQDCEAITNILVTLLNRNFSAKLEMTKLYTKELIDLFDIPLRHHMHEFQLAFNLLNSIKNKDVRPIVANKLFQAICNSDLLKQIILLLPEQDKADFAIKQHKYWFEQIPKCRLALACGRSPLSKNTYSLFSRLDRHILIKICEEAGLLPII